MADTELVEVSDLRDEIEAALDCEDDTEPLVETVADKDERTERVGLFVTDVAIVTEVERDNPGDDDAEFDLLTKDDTDDDGVDGGDMDGINEVEGVPVRCVDAEVDAVITAGRVMAAVTETDDEVQPDSDRVLVICPLSLACIDKDTCEDTEGVPDTPVDAETVVEKHTELVNVETGALGEGELVDDPHMDGLADPDESKDPLRDGDTEPELCGELVTERDVRALLDSEGVVETVGVVRAVTVTEAVEDTDEVALIETTVVCDVRDVAETVSVAESVGNEDEVTEFEF